MAPANSRLSTRDGCDGDRASVGRRWSAYLAVTLDLVSASRGSGLMERSYHHLLSTGRIGGLALRNRIIMTPMGSNLGEGDGIFGERACAYYRERARGGAG